MALRIFDTDPEIRKNRIDFPDDLVGRFRSGRMVGTRPEPLSAWRVTTGDPEVAHAIARQMGGAPAEWQTTGEDHLEVLTDHSSVPILIDGPDALTADMKLWGPRGNLMHHCDGVNYLSPPEDAGTRCGCPELLADRKAFEKSGRGPGPSTNLYFRLTRDPDIGVFRFQSSSWKLAETVDGLAAALARAEGQVKGELRLELVEFRTKAGVDVSYRKPVIKILGSGETRG